MSHIQVLGGVVTLEIVEVLPQLQDLGGCHPGDSGHVTTDAEFGKGVTLETGRVIPGTVPGRGHPGDCKLSPGTGSGRGVTMETVDMCTQVLPQGRGSPWILWTC